MARLTPPFVAGFYRDPAAFLRAAEASSAQGWQEAHEGYMPYPLHAAFQALRIKRSTLGRPVLVLLLLGACAGFSMQYWMMKVDWPILISGKPYNSWPAYVVVTFESGVLAGAIGTFLLVLFVYNWLLPSPVTKPLRQRLSDDLFCLAIRPGAGRTLADLQAFFVAQQADDVEIFHDVRGRLPTIPPADPAARVPPGQMVGEGEA